MRVHEYSGCRCLRESVREGLLTKQQISCLDIVCAEKPTAAAPGCLDLDRSYESCKVDKRWRGCCSFVHSLEIVSSTLLFSESSFSTNELDLCFVTVGVSVEKRGQSIMRSLESTKLIK